MIAPFLPDRHDDFVEISDINKNPKQQPVVVQLCVFSVIGHTSISNMFFPNDNVTVHSPRVSKGDVWIDDRAISGVSYDFARSDCDSNRLNWMKPGQGRIRWFSFPKRWLVHIDFMARHHTSAPAVPAVSTHILETSMVSPLAPKFRLFGDGWKTRTPWGPLVGLWLMSVGKRQNSLFWWKTWWHLIFMLVGGFNHLENISQWEGLSHIWWKIKNVPNHQTVCVWPQWTKLFASSKYSSILHFGSILWGGGIFPSLCGWVQEKVLQHSNRCVFKWNWLVVSTPLNNMTLSWDYDSQLNGKS